MGDRCNMRVSVRADQIEQFCEASELCEPDFFEINPDGKTAAAYFEEVNDGGMDELMSAARAGVAYIGEHSCGGDYGPARFASDGRKYGEREIDFSGNLIVVADEDGNIGSDRVALKAFIRLSKRADAALAAKNPPNTYTSRRSK